MKIIKNKETEKIKRKDLLNKKENKEMITIKESKIRNQIMILKEEIWLLNMEEWFYLESYFRFTMKHIKSL